MKYKRNDSKINYKKKGKYCINSSDYSFFNTALAQSEAEAQLERFYPNLKSSFGTPCEWSVRFEVRNARFELAGRPGGGYGEIGLSPKPRCGTEDKDLPGECEQKLQEKKEYIPGGTKPPCQGGIEGSCALTNTEEKPSEGSSLKEIETVQYRTSLSYSFRVMAKSIVWKPSGKSCGTPQPGAWAAKTGQGCSKCGTRGNVRIIEQSRCYDEIKNYDCCCNCGKQPVPVLQPQSNKNPQCAQIILSAEQQASVLKAAFYAALLAGLCSQIPSILSNWRMALGVAVAAGCAAMTQREEESPCEPN